ncbi:MAG: MarR family transcriptional regulator [Clostridiales bacterium]|nr:MarR family transcriptional regulator [Clostridiales bacterium]
MNPDEDRQRDFRAGREIHRLSKRFHRRMEANGQKHLLTDVSITNTRIICYLYEHQQQDVFQKDLETAFGTTRSTASKVLQLMEQKGLIQRLPVKQDARLKKLVLTERSLELHRRLRQNADEMENRLLSGFTAEEQKQLMSYLERMQRNLD